MGGGVRGGFLGVRDGGCDSGFQHGLASILYLSYHDTFRWIQSFLLLLPASLAHGCHSDMAPKQDWVGVICMYAIRLPTLTTNQRNQPQPNSSLLFLSLCFCAAWLPCHFKAIFKQIYCH